MHTTLNSKLISCVCVCVCVKGKCDRCKGKPKPNLQYEIVSKMDYICFPELAGMEVKVKPVNLRGEEKNREGMPVPVRTVYREELLDI